MLPVAKIQELSVLTTPQIIKPEELILDEKQKVVGYTMRYVKDGTPLCRLFTKTFKDNNRLTSDVVFKLVRDMQETIKHVHSKNILIVDLNEMNFLADKKFSKILFIDVDSYQTPNFPAPALMDSVKDWHAKGFNELTDWFSFGVVSFQLFMGVHPYKGKHPKISGLEDRMKQNISVFDSSVSLPAVVPPLTTLPKEYREWYKAVFQDGKRLPPPLDASAVITIIQKVRKISGTKHLEIKELDEYDASALADEDPASRGPG
jgi:serine/threonine protein kinase